MQISATGQVKKGKNQHFGSTSRRFPELQGRNPLGPGDYNPKPTGLVGQQARSSFKKKDAPFGAANKRFDDMTQQTAQIPGPGAY